MDRKLLLAHPLLDITLSRLCQELIENHHDFSQTVLIGLQPRGIYLAAHLHQKLEALLAQKIPLGELDVTFFRDDFRRRDAPLKANRTRIDFIIEGKKVILIDDVLFTGRTVRAALDAMTAFGRPQLVELLVLIDRLYTRELPIQAAYTGKQVNTLDSQRVWVEWQAQGAAADAIWLIESLQGLKSGE